MSGEALASVTVLVPVLSRDRRLLGELEHVTAELRALDLRVEVLVLAAPGAASETDLQPLLASGGEDVHLLRFAGQIDEAAMLACSFERARGDAVLILPARGAGDPTAVGALYEALCDGADLAFASRGKGPAQSRLFNRLLSRATGTRFHDVAGGARLARRALVHAVPLHGDFHRYLPVLADRMGFSVREVESPAASARPPVRGVQSPAIYLWRALDLLSVFFLARFTRRPLRLFGGVGIGFGLIGAGILFVVGVQRLLGTPLADRPILVLGTLLVGLGVQGLCLGLLGELILFLHGRHLRDYRVREVLEPTHPPIPPPDDR